MIYWDDVSRIAQQAVADYPGEEARDDRRIFIEQEVKANAWWYAQSMLMPGDIQDAVERLLEEDGE